MKGLLRLTGLLLGGCAYYTPDGGPDLGVLPDSKTAQSEIFQSLASAYIDWNYSIHPVWATADGVHDYDGQLGRWTRDAIESQAQSLDRYLRRLMVIDPADLDQESYYDYEVLRGQIAAARFDLVSVRGWENNPNFYRAIISQGLYTLAALDFDTPDRRMAVATERLKQVPEVLAAARDNLGHPPRVYTDLAIEEFSGTYAFLKTGLGDAFSASRDDALRARFSEAQKRALDAVEKFIEWMRLDLLPASTGSFALGPERFRQKVALEEGIDLPVEDLLRRGKDLLRSTQEELKKATGDRPVPQLIRETSKDHPKAETLLADTQALLGQLKSWASTVTTVPPGAACKVQETPVFRRSLSFASMETPGPFEKVARDAYYSITLPDPSWSAERQEQHLSFFNRYSLPLISVHEAYPGHYVQFLALQQCRSKVRKVFGCASFSEGWAHYCEQLYVDLMPDPPLALRIHQLQLALVRICRYIAGIQMHTAGMTVDQAVDLFVTEGYMEHAGAEREARRGTADPTYLVYTLGKHEILHLRAEYLSRTGGTLQSFHHALLATGYPPLPIARKILFGER
ncbi:MAG TPA: DUF885 domain-containing protein [Planctomycetota bacterium]|nr:DUF885 domain-containing protein [Planctomycetota bacterium]